LRFDLSSAFVPSSDPLSSIEPSSRSASPAFGVVGVGASIIDIRSPAVPAPGPSTVGDDMPETDRRPWTRATSGNGGEVAPLGVLAGAHDEAELCEENETVDPGGLVGGSGTARGSTRVSDGGIRSAGDDVRSAGDVPRLDAGDGAPNAPGNACRGLGLAYRCGFAAGLPIVIGYTNGGDGAAVPGSESDAASGLGASNDGKPVRETIDGVRTRSEPPGRDVSSLEPGGGRGEEPAEGEDACIALRMEVDNLAVTRGGPAEPAPGPTLGLTPGLTPGLGRFAGRPTGVRREDTDEASAAAAAAGGPASERLSTRLRP
jgi:hypothetical protein